MILAEATALKLLIERNEELDEVYARIEKADDLLRTHFQTPGYVDTRALAVVSEVLAVLAGDDA